MKKPSELARPWAAWISQKGMPNKSAWVYEEQGGFTFNLDGSIEKDGQKIEARWWVIPRDSSFQERSIRPIRIADPKLSLATWLRVEKHQEFRDKRYKACCANAEELFKNEVEATVRKAKES